MASSLPSRPARSALRAKLADTTRDAIVDALVSLLNEDGGFDVSYAALARRAQVSIQTLYRHFPTREVLLDALTRRAQIAMGLRELPGDREGLLATIRALFPRFDQHAALFAAQAQVGPRSRVHTRGRSRRANAFEEVFAKAIPHVRADRRRAAAGLLHLLVSAGTWHRLRDELGLDGAQSGEITAWAVDTLWRALEAEDERARRGR
ncbi:MAG TPA: TetR/AcrR family transcriptional regulator [Kofleriaceae bacterium]|nr:TetR/AcrR family transcriptional regulator [Kofleriaceae bacterium]